MFLVFQIKEIIILSEKTDFLMNGHSLLFSPFILRPNKGITCL